MKAFYIPTFCIVAIDQLTKFIAVWNLALGESVPVIPGIFHFTLIHNSGVAFGFLREHSSILIIIITISLIVLCVMAHRLFGGAEEKNAKVSGLARWGLVLILGGAIGNWIDRIRVGAVIDFLDFRVWPIFNIADTSISVGVGLYLILLFRRHETA